MLAVQAISRPSEVGTFPNFKQSYIRRDKFLLQSKIKMNSLTEVAEEASSIIPKTRPIHFH